VPCPRHSETMPTPRRFPPPKRSTAWFASHATSGVGVRCGADLTVRSATATLKMRVGNVGKGQVMALWLAGAIVVALAVGIWLYVTYPH
jgi:hypothetical protein